MDTKQYEHFPIPVTQSVLPNGLTVISIETGTAGALAELHFRAGAVDDGKYPGRAHFLEHIKYEGPASDGVHPALRDLYRKGVRGNASTGYHKTSYELSGLTEHLPEMIETLCAIAFDDTIETQYVDLERGVILQELQNGEIQDNVRIRFKKTLFPHCPQFHHAICGTQKSIREMSAIELYEFQERLYAPANAALIVSGGLKHVEVVDVAMRLSLPNRKLQRDDPPKPSQPKLLRTTFEEYNANDAISVYFHGPEDRAKKIHLRFAVGLLNEFPIGLLVQRLRMQERKIYAMSGGTDGFHHHFEMSTIVPPRLFNPVEQAVLEEADRVARMDYPQELFETILQQRRVHFLRRYESWSNGSWINYLAECWLDDDYFDPKEIVLSTTQEHVAEAARTYFNRQNYGCVHMFRKNRS